MSCSIAVAHSSSRSSGSPRARPAASASHISSASSGDVVGVREVGVVLRRRGCAPTRGARRRTAAGRRRAAARRTRPRAGRPRSPRASSKPPASITASITSAPARIRSPRSGLMPGHLAALGRRHARRSSSISSSERFARDAEALDAVRRQLRARAARPRPRLRTVPPMPVRPPAVAPATAPRRAARADVLAQRLDVLALGLARRRRGSARSCARRRAATSACRAASRSLDARELHRAAAEVEHDAVGERRRVDRREVAVARLLLAARAPRRRAPRARAPLEELVAVARVADRRRRDRPRRRRSRWRGRSARTARASRARAPSAPGCSSPVASRPSPTRTASWISSVRFHHESSVQVKTTRRNEFDPRSMTASRSSHSLSLLDQLDAIAVRIADEADPRAALAHPVRRLLGLDALARRAAERAVEVVDGQRDVVVAGAELVGVDAVVVGQLEPVAVAGQAHEDVDRLVADRHPAALLEAERLVEGDASGRSRRCGSRCG